MARVNVYLPDSLANAAKEAGLNVSRLTQEAVRRAISANDTDRWMSAVYALGETGVRHEDVLAAVAAAKRELEEEDG